MKWLFYLVAFIYITPAFATDVSSSCSTADKEILKIVWQLRSQSKYSAAIGKMDLLSASCNHTRKNRFLRAQIYSDRCGVQIFVLDDDYKIQGFFPQLLNKFKFTDSTNINDCTVARHIIKQYAPTSAMRTFEEDYFLTFTNLSSLGIMFTKLDTDEDDVIDMDPCSEYSISRKEIQLMAANFSSMYNSLPRLGQYVSNFHGLSTLIAPTCSDLETILGVSYNLCYPNNEDDITANLEVAFRTLLNINENIGLGTCRSGPPQDIANCVCH